MPVGPELSYAQNMEDYHLSLAFAGQERGRYIDIGGGHPIAGSVSFWFYERGWDGIVVEPQQPLAALHRSLRPRDTLLDTLVTRNGGDAEFYRFDRFHALSTTVQRHADAAVAAYGAGVERVRVSSISLAELCRDQERIDFLKIDVEGAEYDVLAGGDWTRHRPRVVMLEAIAPTTGEPAWDDWEPFLLAQGYRFALFDTLNRFYVAEECPEIMARIPKERAPWDAVRHMYEVNRAPDNALHPDHRLAAALARGFWASLPQMDERVVMSLLRRGAELSGQNPDDVGRLAESEPLRLSLGRIACAYDGGYLDSEPDR